MTGVAIDTNIAIQFLNGKMPIVSKVFTFYPIFLPITVVGELLFGAKNSSHTQKNLKSYTDFIDECLILNTSRSIADNYSEIRLQLKKEGRPIPENDLWIAAICKSFELPLMTEDKHFKYIKGLSLVD